ncbi:MAG: phage holin family protein [Oscillospiraceae bacterium]|nr:phage holin family protein [Oscillospiraceae bacterium]
MDKFTEFFKIVFGGIVTAVSGFLGGMDGIMYALIAFITIDYITGVAVAVKQKKLSSEVGFWGLVRKVCILLLIGIAHYIDCYVTKNGDVVRTVVAMYYIGNEGVSILENCGNLGLPLPPKLIAVMAQIKETGEKSDKEDK